MAITVLNHIHKQKRAETKYGSYDDLKKTETTLVRKTASDPMSSNENPSTINNGIIKPKYIQDSSVVYKKSGYIKDLLGEGN